MIDKELMKEKFKKSISTYPDNAAIQLEIARHLVRYLKNYYESILEIGSYSGFLTKEVVKKINFKSYLAIDIIDSFDFIKNISPKINFSVADIEEIELNEKYDLIISSSSLQWCNDFKKVINKLKSHIKPNGTIAIAIFGKKNLYEIKDAFKVSLDYPSIEDIKTLFSKDAKIIEDIKTLQFENSKDILRHLRYTGVNSLKKAESYSQIKENLKILESKFKNKITYNPVYIID